METAPVQRFPRSMRLKRRRLIKLLFDRSNPDVESVVTGNVRILYRFVPRSATGTVMPVQVGFAPGRCRNAVQRNRLRRCMREVWRTHQHLIDTQSFPSAESLILMILVRSPKQVEKLSKDIVQAMRSLGIKLNNYQEG